MNLNYCDMEKKEAMKILKEFHNKSALFSVRTALDTIIPELKESEDEKIRKEIISFFEQEIPQCSIEEHKEYMRKWISWLEKQGKKDKLIKELGKYKVKYTQEVLSQQLEKQDEQKNEEMPALVCPKCMKSFEKCEDYSTYHNRIRYICPHCEYDGDSVEFETSYKNHPIHSVIPSMIQWKGNNLKQVIEFTGKSPKFNEWFKSFEEYETYVREHNNIFKLFNEDGSNYEVPVGAWIVKTPDGYNVASKAIFKQISTWSEEDENLLNRLIGVLDGTNKEDYHEGWEEKFLPWLKSIKDRVQPQHEQELNEKNIADVFEKVGLAKIVREQGYDALTGAVQSAMIELSKFTPQPKENIDKPFESEWIDLGLPSGTLWKSSNEEGFYTYDKAVETFGDQLPTKEQFIELKSLCRWKWRRNGYKVTGPNGNDIFLSASGYRSCYGNVFTVGTYGYYWSSTPNNSKDAWFLNFYFSEVYMDSNIRCYERSVRLIKNK